MGTASPPASRRRGRPAGVAEATIGHRLTLEAAAFVDAHVAAVAGRIKPAQLDRLVEEAIGR